MRLPTSLKALKFVLAGYSFGVARQLVVDRRLAKAMVYAPGGGHLAGQHRALAVCKKDMDWAQRVQGVNAELARRAAARAAAQLPEPKSPARAYAPSVISTVPSTPSLAGSSASAASYLSFPTPYNSFLDHAGVVRPSSARSSTSSLWAPSASPAEAYRNQILGKPKLVRSGSDPEVGGYVPMHARAEMAEV